MTAIVLGLVALAAYIVDASIVDDSMTTRAATVSDVLGVILAVSLVIAIAAPTVDQTRRWKARR